MSKELALSGTSHERVNPYKRCTTLGGSTTETFRYTETLQDSEDANSDVAKEAARICLGCPRLNICIDFAETWAQNRKRLDAPRSILKPGVAGARLLLFSLSGRESIPILQDDTIGVEPGKSLEDEVAFVFGEEICELGLEYYPFLTQLVGLVFTHNLGQMMTISDVRKVCLSLGVPDADMNQLRSAVKRVWALLNLQKVSNGEIVRWGCMSLPQAKKTTIQPSLAIEIQEVVPDVNDELVIEYRDFILYGEGKLPGADQIDEVGVALLEALRQAELYGIDFESVNQRRNTARLLLGLDIVDTFVALVPNPPRRRLAVTVHVRASTEYAARDDTKSWQDLGACKGASADTFYPDNDDDAIQAKQICAGCDVRIECLEHALSSREKLGVWGGATERERRRIIRMRRRSY